METKSFNTRLSKALGCEQDEAAKLIDGFCRILAREASELNSVAIPGFGTFVTTKKDEEIVSNPSTGERTLVPPSISIGFQTSVVLRKKISR